MYVRARACGLCVRASVRARVFVEKNVPHSPSPFKKQSTLPSPGAMITHLVISSSRDPNFTQWRFPDTLFLTSNLSEPSNSTVNPFLYLSVSSRMMRIPAEITQDAPQVVKKSFPAGKKEKDEIINVPLTLSVFRDKNSQRKQKTGIEGSWLLLPLSPRTTKAGGSRRQPVRQRMPIEQTTDRTVQCSAVPQQMVTVATSRRRRKSLKKVASDASGPTHGLRL